MDYLNETIYVNLDEDMPGVPVGTIKEYVDLTEQDTAKLLYTRLNRNRTNTNWLSIDECNRYAQKIRDGKLGRYLTENLTGEIYITEEAWEYFVSLLPHYLHEYTGPSDNFVQLSPSQLKRVLSAAKMGDQNNRITNAAHRSDKKDISDFRVTKHARNQAKERIASPESSKKELINIIKIRAQAFIDAADVMLDQIYEGNPRVLYLSDIGNIAISEMNEIVTIYTKDQFIKEEGAWVISTLEVIRQCKKENEGEMRT